ncbi:probable LRR receptor-like serine/threonine-protein kinase At2g24230 [Salvia miltiorrhiza]|uniref:probable LRR receptor-like serine/threonine-protein kinase At2g24230 n=1 Tax=Salvia miltiorrhiza TaxID=226208 RepID=UPI0025AD1C49|nr:probable LRR receptor-like serine/threonine-protein kinase At2g24230 [Salvia miltiorrhiza]XP_057767837.1 probable LRR receptor-like serine/threonine-protein kinase At2g24230 [Salvia miltiorrhiza]
MGVAIFGCFLVVTLLFRPLVCQQPNTDESFLLEFFAKMGLNPPQKYGFSGSLCSWKGVVCDDEGENVVKLEASGMGLSGVIPDTTVGKLTKLESLDLSSNKITTLPSDFWSLGSLINLNLSHNQISGSLFSNIGNFGHLQSLDLSFNKFSGSIPETVSSLTKLQALNLSHNVFESGVPLGILQCLNLVSVDLSENKLNGSLPSGFGAALPQLKFLSLAENDILGRDSDFTGMKSVRYLNLSGNLFKGSVLGVFEGALEVVDLSRNQFQGHIAQVNFTSTFSWSNLLYLDMSENELSGEFFFTGLHNPVNLRHLNLAHNRFTKQQFLINVDVLTHLEYLNLSATNLVGDIPSNISRLTSLATLDLSDNHLSSHIPPLVSKSLKFLDLSHNNLTGDIPLAVIDELHDMDSFNFSYNNLSFCASRFPPKTLQASFIGSTNSCPIAANPDFFKKKPPKHRGLKIALALTISMVFLLVGLLVLAFRCRRKTRMWAVKQDSYKEEQTISGPFSFQTDSTTWVADVKQATSVPVVIFEKPLLNFTFADLLSATSHFDRGTLLAEGRFGPVYGGLLPGGIHVAVKVLVHGSTMTDHEAARELEYLGRIKHPNLVPLTGYCLAGDQRIAIYDYMDNGNLQKLLYDLPLGIQTTEDWSTDTWEDENNGIQNVGPEGSPTTWRFRHKIALGTARALAFLHHGCSPPIIHRDVKASSVYLDSNLEPRLSDFGISKIFGNGAEDEIARGSPGYVPPEFLEPESSSPKAPTPKSDIYGFGVILFELITGKKPVEDVYQDEKDANLTSWVRGLVRRNQASRAIDPKIRGTAPDAQIIEALKIGYLCTAEIPSKRPSMQQVVGLLKDLEQITQQ